MKSFVACAVLVAVFAQLQAQPTPDGTYNPEEGLKKLADVIGDVTKKMEESTGIHSEFDKEKFLKAGKGLIEKLTEAQAKLKEAVDTNFKNLPAAEDIKKKVEDVQKQLSETLKTLNSPEVQKSADKLRETLSVSSKKISESINELVQKFGLSPPPAIQKSLNEISDEFSKSFKVFQDKVQKIIEEASNELKKKKA